MEKYSLFSGKADSGAPLIHRVEPGSSYGLGETDGLSKTASGEHLPEVIELIESIQAQPGFKRDPQAALALSVLAALGSAPSL